VLELLASCRDGCTDAITLAHGFSIEMMVELVNAVARECDGRAHCCRRQDDRGRAGADHGCGAEGAQRGACMKRLCHPRKASTVIEEEETKMTPYPGDRATWLSNDIDPNTPAGLCKALRSGAEICLTGAKKLNELSPGWDLPDRQILAFHALELALKAFLAKHGLTREKLRKKKPYGEDLDHLYSDAVQGGLSPLPHSKELIAAVNEYHNAHIIRYEFATTRTVPTCATLFPIVEAILAACSGC
jgi:hypothetical protein